VIVFSWTAPTFNGGKPVLDYRINYDQAEGIYVELDTTTDTSYSTLSVPNLELNPGSTYSFTVEARNQVGHSLTSIPI
jgi:hypothetical protein